VVIAEGKDADFVKEKVKPIGFAAVEAAGTDIRMRAFQFGVLCVKN